MFDYTLCLYSGVDIPIPELQTALHQPTLKEISYLGESDFFLGLSLLCINKYLYIQDNSLLETTTNFQLLMTILKEKDMSDKKTIVLQVIELLFPKRQPIIMPTSILLNGKKDEESTYIDENNFDAIQEKLKKIFCLSENTDQKIYNPKNERARRIAEKIMEGRKKVAEMNASEGKSMLGNYATVLAVGLHSLSWKDCIDLTVYQIYALIERYIKYTNWNVDLRSRLAGGGSDKPMENWMK